MSTVRKTDTPVASKTDLGLRQEGNRMCADHCRRVRMS